MKKIFAIVLLTLMLASCGFKKENKTAQITTETKKVTVKTPEDALKTTQKAFIEKIDKLANYKESWVSNGKINLNFSNKEVKADWNIDYNVEFDQKAKAFSWKFGLKFNIDGEAQWQKVKANWDLMIKLASLKNKFFAQLAKFELNIDSKDESAKAQVEGIKQMVVNQIGKWYFTEIPEQQEVNIDTKQFFTNKDKVVKILEKYTVFKSVKENENKDFYDYDIKLNEDNIVKIIEEINKTVDSKDKKELTKEDIEKIKKDIAESDIKWNIKILKKDLRYFSLTLSSQKNQNVFKLDNLENDFNFSINDEATKAIVDFKGKKTDNKIEWKLEISEAWEKKAIWDIMVERNGDNFAFEWKFKDVKNSENVFNIEINDTTNEQNVKIKEPAWAIDIKELQKSMMPPMWNPAMQPAWNQWFWPDIK